MQGAIKRGEKISGALHATVPPEANGGRPSKPVAGEMFLLVLAFHGLGGCAVAVWG
jgi:hypothetical protein